MSQGVYVFLVFVCKSNVLTLLFGQNTPQGRVLSKVLLKNPKYLAV